MALVDVNMNLINGKRFPGPVKQVEAMLGKALTITSKLELCGMIAIQYKAIETLVDALALADPDNKLIKGLGRAPKGQQ
jgi:hypothetical protein